MRVLEWASVLLGTAVYSAAWAAVPIVEPVFASFGRELPWPSRLWLAVRPVYLLLCAASTLSAGLLLAFRERRAVGRARRALWLWLAACLAFAAFSAYALVAPQFIGSLAG